MSNTTKNRENNVRRKLARQGYILHKSRSGGTVTVNGVPNLLLDDRGGYMIVESTSNMIAAGEKYNLSLEDVEGFTAERMGCTIVKEENNLERRCRYRLKQNGLRVHKWRSEVNGRDYYSLYDPEIKDGPDEYANIFTLESLEEYCLELATQGEA